jgi:hypothetical protein
MAKDGKDEATMDERLKRLEAAEAALKEREKAVEKQEEALAAQKDSGAQRPIRPSEAVTVGEGYKFQVGPIAANTGLPTKEIDCCDESEALRWYVATTGHPKNPTKQVDPVSYPLWVKCVDQRREENRKISLRIAMIRAKSERGNALTQEEESILDAAEAERLGL